MSHRDELPPSIFSFLPLTYSVLNHEPSQNVISEFLALVLSKFPQKLIL
jgi:hypothetical protein